MSEQSAIDRAYAKGVRGLEVAQAETATRQALALTLTLSQMLAILEEYVSEPAGLEGR